MRETSKFLIVISLVSLTLVFMLGYVLLHTSSQQLSQAQILQTGHLCATAFK